MVGPSIDAAVFLTVGGELAEGAAPYAGAWDHKPPGIHLVAWLGHAVAGDAAWWFVWAASVVATATLAILLFNLTLRVARPRVAAVVALLAALVTAAYPLALGGGMAETFAAPLAVGAIIASGAGTRASWIVAGALLALATTFALLAIAAAPAILLIRVPRADRAVSLALILFGFTAVGVAIVAALALTGGLAAAADAIVSFNRAYVATGGAPTLLAGSIVRFIGSLLPLVALAAGAAIGWRRIGPDARPYALAAAAWLGTGLAMVVLGRQVYGHYLILLIPPLALVAAVGATVQHPSSRPQRTVAAAMAVVTGIVAVTLLVGLALEEVNVTRAVADAAGEAAATTHDLTDDDDRILVWGNAAAVYLTANRRPSSPHFYLAPLMTRGYTTDALIDAEVVRLCTSPPAVVIDAGSLQPGAPGVPPMLEPRPTLQEQRRIDLLDPLRAVVAEHYQLVSPMDGFLVYEVNVPEVPLGGASCSNQ